MIDIANLNNIYKNRFIANNNQNNPQRISGKYPNLAPLSADTISFSRAKSAPKKPDEEHPKLEQTKQRGESIDKSHMGSTNVVTHLREEAEYSYGLFKYNIDSILGSLVATETDPNRPVEKIEYRLKSTGSILEKACDKKLRTKRCIKEKLTDIIGARVVLRDATEGGGNQVIDKLTQAVKDNKIKIIEIENYRPSRKYQYASQSKLNNLAKISREKGIYNFDNKEKDTASGYMAIHMLIELKQGFVGELQIVGKDVARLKDIEDLCYKAMEGKNIQKKYADIDQLFIEKGLKTPKGQKEDKQLKKEFMDYTKAAYLHERQKAPRELKKHTDLLHIPKGSIIPEELDFNNLETMKQNADQKAAKAALKNE